MQKYTDGFILPVPRKHVEKYKKVAEKVAEIWKEYGAIEYIECVGDDLQLEGTRSFIDVVDLKEDEVVIFGWVVFPSKEVRDSANKKVPEDPRMAEIVAPLITPEKLIFDAERMVYGGFQPIVESKSEKKL
jgi:uncharacterized protein YbaA (DUF1428 family)